MSFLLNIIDKFTNRYKNYFFVKTLKHEKNCEIHRSARVGHDCTVEGNNLFSKGVRFHKSRIGFASYLGDGADLLGVSVGRFCSIGPRVRNIVGRHPTSFVSTHPYFYSKKSMWKNSYVSEQKYSEYGADDKGYLVEIGNDVWIGADVIILDDVKIGDGAIIGAGAVVTGNIPDYAIAVGVPAKVIKYRHEKSQIERLQKIRWWDRDEEWIKIHAEEFENVDVFLRKVDNEEPL